MTAITVIIKDHFNGDEYQHPLIYVVNVNNPQDCDEVAASVRRERLADIGELEDGDTLELELIMAFDGDLTPVADWRK